MLAAGHQAKTEASAVQHERNEYKSDQRKQHEPVEFKAADIHEERLLLRNILDLGRNVVGIFCGVDSLDDNGSCCDAEHIQSCTDDGLVCLEVYAGDRKQGGVENACEDGGKNCQSDGGEYACT